MMQNAESRTPNADRELQTEGNEGNEENIEHRTSNAERRKKQLPMSNEFRFNDVTLLTI
jgi:hypothetical protein